MKIKIFCDTDVKRLENKVNEFLETISNVIDIKYSVSVEYSEILILYKET